MMMQAWLKPRAIDSDGKPAPTSVVVIDAVAASADARYKRAISHANEKLNLPSLPGAGRPSAAVLLLRDARSLLLGVTGADAGLALNA